MTLRIYGEILAFVRRARPVMDAIGKQDADLGRQGRRALTSMPLNVAEGMWRRGGNSRIRFETAMGSTNEVKAVLEVAQALGYAEIDAALLDEADRIARTLHRLCK